MAEQAGATIRAKHPDLLSLLRTPTNFNPNIPLSSKNITKTVVCASSGPSITAANVEAKTVSQTVFGSLIAQSIKNKPVESITCKYNGNNLLAPSSLRKRAPLSSAQKICRRDCMTGGSSANALSCAKGHSPATKHHSSISSHPSTDHVTVRGTREGFAGEPDYPYDPKTPNEYVKYCRERLAKHDEEERKQLEYIQFAEKQQLEALSSGESCATNRGYDGINYSIDTMATISKVAIAGGSRHGESRSIAAPKYSVGRGRGISNIPAWMTRKQQQLALGGEDDVSSVEEKGPFTSSIITNAMLQLSPSLPETEQVHKKSLVMAPPPPLFQVSFDSTESPLSKSDSRPMAMKKRKKALFRNPTRVLLLKNMLAPGEGAEEDDEFAIEVGDECTKYGPVSRCVVREASGESLLVEKETGISRVSVIPDCERVRTFVQFERLDAAIRAFVDMEGRFFGGRQIKCTFFDEERFEKGDLARTNEEDK